MACWKREGGVVLVYFKIHSLYLRRMTCKTHKNLRISGAWAWISVVHISCSLKPSEWPCHPFSFSVSMMQLNFNIFFEFSPVLKRACYYAISKKHAPTVGRISQGRPISNSIASLVNGSPWKMTVRRRVPKATSLSYVMTLLSSGSRRRHIALSLSHSRQGHKIIFRRIWSAKNDPHNSLVCEFVATRCLSGARCKLSSA